jgi:hypothetical protein
VTIQRSDGLALNPAENLVWPGLCAVRGDAVTTCADCVNTPCDSITTSLRVATASQQPGWSALRFVMGGLVVPPKTPFYQA